MADDNKPTDLWSRLGRFLQKYAAFLTIVGGTPFGSALVHVLPPPAHHAQLRVIAALLAMAAFSFVVLAIDSVSRSLERESIWKRAAPLVGMVGLSISGFVGVLYVMGVPSGEIGNGLAYVFIWPLAAGSSTTLLLCLLNQDDSREHAHSMAEWLRPHLPMLQGFLENFVLLQQTSRENKILRAVADDSFRSTQMLTAELAAGKFIVDGDDVAPTFSALARAASRFDAISVKELPYWVASNDSDVQQYFLLSADFVDSGKPATRMFLVGAHDIDKDTQRGILLDVLTKHQDAGIGFAVVVEDELLVEQRRLVTDLDYALWDCGDAVSVYRFEGNRRNRRMSVFFGTDHLRKEVETRKKSYATILSHVVMADATFLANHAARLEEKQTRAALDRNNKKRHKTIGLAATKPFAFVVNTREELAQALKQFAAARSVATTSYQRISVGSPMIAKAAE